MKFCTAPLKTRAICGYDRGLVRLGVPQMVIAHRRGCASIWTTMKTEQRAGGGGGLAVRLVGVIIALVVLAGCGRQKRVNLFEEGKAQEAMTEVAKKFALPAKVLNADITPLSLTIRVQDPAQPSHVDEYGLEHSYVLDDRYHHVSMSGPKPVQLSLINENLEENLFNLSDVNIASVAATAKAALERTALEGGGITSIHIQRRLFLIPVATCGEVEWEISVKSDREYATAHADAKGRITRLNLDGTNRAKNLNLHSDNKELPGIVAAMRETFGSTRGILKLFLNRNFLGFDARDPQKPKRLMSFTANLNGVLMGMDAFNGGPGGPQLPDERFFGVDDVDWTQVPGMLKQAQAKLEIAKGRLYAVSLAKATLGGEAQPLRWTVDIRDGEGEDGEVEFDPKGMVTRVKLPKSRRVPVNAFEAEGARLVIVGIKKTFGAHAKLIELAFAGSGATIIARDPKQPAKIRDWMYDDDHFADYKGSDQTAFYRNLQESSFLDLDEVEAALPRLLPKLEKAAVERLKMPDGKVERITFCRQQKMQPPSPKLTIQIHVQSADGKSGWVSYDLQGNFVQVMTP
ncbi:MAG: hypothetical protein JWR15_290 [Prosthecobacter sp.]|nr:hypothetical protein [Prosthecobacter sp.]